MYAIRSYYALDVEIVHSASNNAPYPMQTVTFNVAVDPSCDFDGNWAIYKIGDPTFFKSWNFSSTNPEREYQFPKAGTYRVVADVYNSRITSYNVCYTKLLRTIISHPNQNFCIESHWSGSCTMVGRLVPGRFYHLN